MIIKTSPDEIQNYLVDASNFTGACDAVYFPESAADISQILKEASSKKTPVTVAGNGTGLTGARVPRGGIVISTDKLNRIIEINENDLFAVVEPGVILADFQESISGKGLLYPPDPTDKNCFIGGTVATNASGEKTFKYGPTRDYVLELEVVLPDGEILKLERGKQKADGFNLELKAESGKIFKTVIPEYEMPRTKNASGYFCRKDMDAIDLFIGSEGTLGVITKIKLKLLKAPEKIISCVVFFDDELNALSFISEARNISFNTRLRKDPRTLDALALEYFDGRALKFLSGDYPNIPGSAQAGVWFEQEVLHENEDTFFEFWLELISQFKGDEESAWFAVTDADKKKIQEFRHAVSAKINEFISKRGLRKLGTDVAVPDDNFGDLYGYCEKLMDDEKMNYVIYGHAGNSHIHLNMLPENEAEYTKGRELYHDICRKAIELGGTVSAEHGIGKAKTDYLIEMYGIDNVKKMAAVKKFFDPDMILGRGNIFDEKILNG